MLEPMGEDLPSRTASNRHRMAVLFAELDEDQLDAPSLCAGWTCRDVLGHVVMCIEVGLARFLLEVARDGGRSARTSDRLAREFGRRAPGDLVDVLSRRSADAVSQPGVGVFGPFADSCIHMRDVAIPLGLPATPPESDWVEVVDFLTTSRARAAGFLPRGRLDGLALRVDGHDGEWGDGELVTGSGEALVLSLTGRPVLLDRLAGPGASALRERVLAAVA
jgi:uncharacterized protein (TIGR03083 family)